MMRLFFVHFFYRTGRQAAGIIAAVILVCLGCMGSPVLAALGEWSTLAAVPGSVSFGGSLLFPGNGNDIYASAGGNSSGFYKYNTSNDTWTTLAVVPGAAGLGGHLLYTGSGNTIYASVGGNSTGFYKYNMNTDTWTTLAAVPGTVEEGGNLLYPGSGDFIYLSRGNTSTGFYKYSISNNVWTTLAPVPGAVSIGGKLVYPGSGNDLYASAGGSSTGFYKYNMSNDAWTTLAVVPSTVGLGGHLLYPGSGNDLYASVGGGSTGFYKYSMTNNVWTAQADLPRSLGSGGNLVFPGSGNAIYASRGNGSNAFYKYSISNNTWTTLAAATGLFVSFGGNMVLPGSAGPLYATRGGGSNSFMKFEDDAIAPSGGAVVDNGQYTSINDSISASWHSFTDNGTIVQYSYSAYITQEGSSLVAPTSTSNTAVDEPFFAINDGSTIVFQVQAIDSVSNSSDILSTNGITVDTTAPNNGSVEDEGIYSGSTTVLSASWSGFSDAVSGISEYSYSIGTSAGDTSIRTWTSAGTANSILATGLTLVHGTQYFFNVRAIDAVGNAAAVVSSNGITVDTVPPMAGTVTDEGSYLSRSTTTLSASWSGFGDALSGIGQYSYSIGTSAGDTSVRNWTSAGTNTSVTATGLTLSSGTQYFINIRAIDNAGNLSTVVSTDGILVDTAAPTTGTVTDEGATTGNATQLTATLSGFGDTASGLAEYSYSIGTSAADISIKDWTSNGTSTTITATGLDLRDQQTYFINVKTKDNAGNTSGLISSDGIKYIADANGPITGTVTDEGDSTTSTSQLSASWSGFSDASGIVQYSYSIGTSAGDTSIRTWTSAGTDTHVVATGLTLAYGAIYVFNVRAIDTFGNLSAVASTDGIQVFTVYGDIDQDGDIDLQDALTANHFATGKGTPTATQILFADVAEPKDGQITTEDANLILRCAKGTIRGNPLYPWCPAIVREASDE